jgi:alpha-glucuronidase
MKRRYLLTLILIGALTLVNAENGYNLWLRYQQKTNADVLKTYRTQIDGVFLQSETPTAQALKTELNLAFTGMLNTKPVFTADAKKARLLFLTSGKAIELGIVKATDTASLKTEGYLIKYLPTKQLAIVANADMGLLYGGYRLLMLMQANTNLTTINLTSVPKIMLRVLNHWDNLDRTVERGYSGFSIWDWHKLPDYHDPRYTDYARANASIGINGVVLNNVNANALILTPQYLKKVAALANIFRPYGIKVYLTARFSAPIEIGGMPQSDPLDPKVQEWWNQKANEIYSYIPDFGGFLVKANSEGQPGPQNYGRNHQQGANMLALALAPHNGVVMWRAFVYETDPTVDRAKQAYHEFVPHDGTFLPNVLVQVKNGAIDFQPREPFHPMFGAMPKSQLMMEFQITQEYTGCATHLFYQAPLYKEVLDADTYTQGKGSTVAKVIDGSLTNPPLTGIAGVANIGNDFNWCGHPFAQANWYAFGRLAWDHGLSSELIADEWLAATFAPDPQFMRTARTMMMESRENLVDYMTPPWVAPHYGLEPPLWPRPMGKYWPCRLDKPLLPPCRQRWRWV